MDRVREAYGLWLAFRENVDRRLREAGLTWGDVAEALSAFSSRLEGVVDVKYLRVSLIAYPGIYLDHL